jgi:hypothetical protein
VYYPIETKVDVIITEMQHTLFRQPHFYRYCAGFAGQKPIIVAENPYGGIVPQLLKMLDAGKGYDLYRIFLLEASVYGCNMAVPYGGWMGNTIKDSFYPPRELTAQVQDFLYTHEDFYPKTPVKGAAVLYSFNSYYWRETTKGNGGNTMLDEQESLLDCTTSEWSDPNASHIPFWDAIKSLSDVQAMYDVKMLADGDVREDDFTLDVIRPYPLVVVPDCYILTQNQADVLVQYVKEGGSLLIHGRIGENVDAAARLKELDNVVFTDCGQDFKAANQTLMEGFKKLYKPACTLECISGKLGIQRFDKDGRTFVHILNYGFDASRDAVLPAETATVSLRDVSGNVMVYTLDGSAVTHEVNRQGDAWKITLHHLPVYTVIEIA